MSSGLTSCIRELPIVLPRIYSILHWNLPLLWKCSLNIFRGRVHHSFHTFHSYFQGQLRNFVYLTSCCYCGGICLFYCSWMCGLFPSFILVVTPACSLMESLWHIPIQQKIVQFFCLFHQKQLMKETNILFLWPKVRNGNMWQWGKGNTISTCEKGELPPFLDALVQILAGPETVPFFVPCISVSQTFVSKHGILVCLFVILKSWNYLIS